jgi:hypothetical protein
MPDIFVLTRRLPGREGLLRYLIQNARIVPSLLDALCRREDEHPTDDTRGNICFYELTPRRKQNGTL